MSDRDFGGMIREARERLGMSQSRVADLVGRASSTVKAWERGRSQPNDRTVVASLAAVLDLDEAELIDAVGMEAAEPKSYQTLEESLSEIAAPDLRSPPPATGETTRRTPTGAEDERAIEPPADETERLLSRRELRAQREAEAAPSEGLIDRVNGRLEQARSRRPRRPKKTKTQAAPTPVTAPAPAPASGSLMVAAPAPSYLEDPQQRLLYRSRSVFLAIGVLVLAIVFVWAAGEMLDSISSSLDAVFGNE